MLPADNKIAGGGIMAVVAKVAAHELELNPHALPAILLAVDAALGFAVRVEGLDGFHLDSG